MPLGFDIGPLTIRFYGIIVMTGAVAGAWLAAREARRRGLNTEIVWDVLTWLIIGGVIGARLWHILTPPKSSTMYGVTTSFYLTHPLDALKIWDGGLGVPGAVIGGALALYIYTRRAKLQFSLWTDVGAPGLALGQAIGRWGNFVNQELYGAPTNLPWAITIEPQYRLPEFRTVEKYHPLFLYESLWSLLNMTVLLWLGRRFSDRLKKGDLFLIYLIIYPFGRFWLEFLRLDIVVVSGINANQMLMLATALCASAVLIWRHRKIRSRPQSASAA